MFSARLSHSLDPAAVTLRRAEFDRALAQWAGFLGARPGLRQVVIHEDPNGEVTSISVWDGPADFLAAMSDPGRDAAASALLAFARRPAHAAFGMRVAA